VRNYEQLSSTFDQIFNGNRRLDFVFANAGIAEFGDYYATQPDTGIPPKPDLGVVEVNLDGALYTSYLAMHYFRRSPESSKGDRNLIFTSSIGGIYPCELSPVYVSTKRT
jgi:NADP-dependent 3-hydroxy acid dehydrogenase YdfG